MRLYSKGHSRADIPFCNRREGNPAKKSFLPFMCYFILFLFFSKSLDAQNKTYKFMGLQITYPSGCTINGIEKESNIIMGESCSFVLSALFRDGSEERMKVSASRISAATFGLAILGLGTEDLTNSQILLLDVLMNSSVFSGPLYSHVIEANNEGVEDTYAYMDYSGRCYQETRITEKLYYNPFKGRVYSKIIGDYLVSFVMQIPSTHSFNYLQQVANSLSYSF